jgi:hypothetical protein
MLSGNFYFNKKRFQIKNNSEYNIFELMFGNKLNNKNQQIMYSLTISTTIFYLIKKYKK